MSCSCYNDDNPDAALFYSDGKILWMSCFMDYSKLGHLTEAFSGFS